MHIAVCFTGEQNTQQENMNSMFNVTTKVHRNEHTKVILFEC